MPSEENGGVAFSSVITQYKFYRQEGVSLADIVVSSDSDQADM